MLVSANCWRSMCTAMLSVFNVHSWSLITSGVLVPLAISTLTLLLCPWSLFYTFPIFKTLILPFPFSFPSSAFIFIIQERMSVTSHDHRYLPTSGHLYSTLSSTNSSYLFAVHKIPSSLADSVTLSYQPSLFCFISFPLSMSRLYFSPHNLNKNRK